MTTNLPHSLEAEQSCLGAMLLERRAMLRATERLEESDFYREIHRRIFAAIVEVSRKSNADDFLFDVVDELRCRGELEECGGASYLLALVDACASAANIDAYIKPVLRTATQRRVLALCQKVARAAIEPMDETEPLLEQLERGAIEITQRGKTSVLAPLESGLLPAFEQILRNYRDKGTVSGVPSGFPDLDRKTTGFHPGNLVVVGARPGMGKSSFGLQIAEHVSIEQGKPVALFSLEMSMEELTQRLLARHAHIDISSLRRGFVEGHFHALGDAFVHLKDVPLFVDSSPAPTMFEIRARAHRLAAEQGLSLVVVDYLQRINGGAQRGNRNEIVGQMARDLKSLARELQVPVIALAQINRGVEDREDKRPVKSDLRESGDIEAEADVILLLYRESYYRRNGQESAIERAEVIIDKNRQGPSNCTIPLGWRGEFAEFVGLSAEA